VEREVDKTREGLKTLVVDSEDGLGERGQQKASGGNMGGGGAAEVGGVSSGAGLEGTEGVREELRKIVGELVVTEGKEEGNVNVVGSVGFSDARKKIDLREWLEDFEGGERIVEVESCGMEVSRGSVTSEMSGGTGKDEIA